jgi:hypothetical protein
MILLLWLCYFCHGRPQRNLEMFNVIGQKLCSAPYQITANDLCNDCKYLTKFTNYEIRSPSIEQNGPVIGIPVSCLEILHQLSYLGDVRNFPQYLRADS